MRKEGEYAAVDISKFLTRVNYVLRGTDEDAPTFGDEEAVYWLDTLNRKKDELYQDTSKGWFNTFRETPPNEPGTVATTGTTTLTGTGTFFTDYKAGDKLIVDGETVRTIDTITNDTTLTVTVAFSNTASSLTFTRQTIIKDGISQYSLHRSFLSLSGDDMAFDEGNTGAYILQTDGNRRFLRTETPQDRNYNTRQVFISGQNPQVINFTDDIASTENIVGGILYYPGYYLPDDLTAETDLLPFLDPNWGVMSVASEIAFGDITYEDRAPDLNAKANGLYQKMVLKNRQLVHKNTRKIPYNIRKIRSVGSV